MKLRAFPSSECAFCHAQTVLGETCPDCAKKYHLDGFVSFFPYANELIREIIKTWKYQNIVELIDSVGFLLKEELGAAKKSRYFLKNKNNVLVPIPLHKRRHRERGFNQSAMLAEKISKIIELPAKEMLIRAKLTSPQASLRGRDRIINAVDAFSVIDETAVLDKSAILVDDVITTGSTLNDAARALKKAGAAEVWAITFAYG